MKLATVTVLGQPRVVAQQPDHSIVDVGAVLREPGIDMHKLIESADDLMPRLRDRLANPPVSPLVDVTDICWAPPAPRPSKIVGVALNNAVFQWLSWRKMSAPSFFLKPPSALIGHQQAVRVQPEWGLTHPEPELAAIIGRRVSQADPADVLEAVFGYTIINDITSPGLKSGDSVELVMPEQLPVDEPWREKRGADDHSIYLTYHARSKGADTFAPMGPWLVTADEIPNPNDLGVRGYLAGELVLEDSTANLTFSVQQVLSHLSQTMTLMPGDVVHFGTAARPTIPERYPTIRSLDITRLQGPLAVEIDGIGRLDNPVISKAPGSRGRSGEQIAHLPDTAA